MGLGGIFSLVLSHVHVPLLGSNALRRILNLDAGRRVPRWLEGMKPSQLLRAWPEVAWAPGCGRVGRACHWETGGLTP